MAEFVPFDENVEVLGKILLSQVKIFGDSFYKSILMNFFKKFGVHKIEENKWYPQKIWLAILKEIQEHIGKNTIFIIGRSIPDTAKFPEDITDLKSALESLDIAYHLNHRGGEIGYYKLHSFDPKKREAVFECKNPYPEEFDKGILVGLLRKFAPDDSYEQMVEIDNKKPKRSEGANSTWYILKW